MFRPVCLFCDYHPCSVDASFCPRCGHADPNPGFFSRLSRVISSLLAAISLIIPAAISVVFGWSAHPYAGIGIGLCFLAAAVVAILKALWYAVDPTFTILPRPR